MYILYTIYVYDNYGIYIYIYIYILHGSVYDPRFHALCIHQTETHIYIYIYIYIMYTLLYIINAAYI